LLHPAFLDTSLGLLGCSCNKDVYLRQGDLGSGSPTRTGDGKILSRLGARHGQMANHSGGPQVTPPCVDPSAGG